ncbi:Tyrosine-protein phosphatase 10D [Orchesella cincta]|uniref:protein-tyrosine-phosphatase n=1 Tax=Orchesella cincta TaxID=48709 RepID=A0A1D2MAZ6_ORCCI|nr:Tyrosine-protein phosphatase 10D [Orchesella cincta]
MSPPKQPKTEPLNAVQGKFIPQKDCYFTCSTSAKIGTPWIFLSILILIIQGCQGADLEIQVPLTEFHDPNGIYRLDYSPAVGYPPPNSTFIAGELVSSSISFRNGLPGTKYSFRLHYSNDTIQDWVRWSASITTLPDPPENLAINVRHGRPVAVKWEPPLSGGFSKFKLRLIPLNEGSGVDKEQPRSFIEDKTSLTLPDLKAGASYEIQLYTIFENKESTVYMSANFTTKPNTPGRFIVWYRNETTLLVLWQPPYPAGVFTGYKVKIEPPDSGPFSELDVAREGEPPGPAQAAFNNLLPGRAYNISVETVSSGQISVPTTAQYRTVPLRPSNITFNPSSLTTSSFQINWSPPVGYSEFDRYSVAITNPGLKSQPLIILKNESRTALFDSGLEPGRTYNIAVKTVSDKLPSWPVRANVTTRPLPVEKVNSKQIHNGNGEILIEWEPNSKSKQDSYRITTQEVEESFVNEEVTETTSFKTTSLFPGRNYSISIRPVSNGIEGEPITIFQATRPSSPIVGNLTVNPDKSLAISWKSDVSSKQAMYLVQYTRNDTGEQFNATTTEDQIYISELYPGATYALNLYAVSHGLLSEKHDYFQTVFPNPIRNLSASTSGGNVSTLHLRWMPPHNSLYSGYLIRWRTNENTTWTEEFLGSSTSPQEKFLGGLVPGEKYIIRVNSISQKTESGSPQQVIQSVKPSSIAEVDNEVDTQGVSLLFDKPKGRIDKYFVRWEALDYKLIQAEDEETSEEDLRVFLGEKVFEVEQVEVEYGKMVRIPISPLAAGMVYKVALETSSYEIRGNSYNITIRTRPLITSQVFIVPNQNQLSEVTLTYTPTPLNSHSYFDRYRFQVSDSSISPQEKEANDTERKVLFASLVPGRLYNFTMWTLSNEVVSHPLIRQERLYPEPISGGIRASSISANEIKLEWDKPQGDYDAFQVQYINEDERLVDKLSLVPSISIKNLRPYRNYTFTVSVQSGKDGGFQPTRSSPVSATFQTEESVPDKIEYFEVIARNPNNITFEWVLPASKRNGNITGYLIKYGAKGEPLSNIKTFGAKEEKGVIGGLEPGISYRFAIEARTKMGQGPAHLIETGTSNYANGSGASDEFSAGNGSLILGIIVPIILMMVFISCLVYGRRKKEGRGFDNVSMLSASPIVESVSRPVKIKEFGDHFRLMCADSEFRFSEEFEELKRVGREQLCLAAELPVNRPKNRFTNILPFDSSRFKLQPTDDDEGSDYINANYVTGFNSPREFIVTQGPLPSTRDDFWRMCWESNSRAIVMLTRCVEKGREKCDRYWPTDAKPQYYGDIQVKILNESRFTDWSISEFRLKRGDQYRIIQHLHFTTWPDFGVPDPPQILVRFVRAFRDRLMQECDRVRPIIVHCSAGVGRSGTFIALDRVLQHIKKADFVDIFGIVYNMRLERVWMVQTEQQYICIHQCLISVLEGRENDIPLPREIKTNDGFEDDEGIAETGM